MRVWCFISVIALASAGVWAYNLSHFGSLSTPGANALPWPLLAIVFYLAETYVVHLQFRKQAHTLSASEIGLTLGLFFVSPIGLLVAQLVGTGIAIVVHRRQKAIKLWFNLAEVSLACGLGLLVFRSLVDGGSIGPQAWAAALLAAAGAYVRRPLGDGRDLGREGRLVAPQLPRTLAVSLVGALSACCLGLLVVELVVKDPPALLSAALPLLACGGRVRAYMMQREQRERVEFLYESMRATQGAPGVRARGRRAAGRGTAAPARGVRGDPPLVADRRRAGAAQHERTRGRGADAAGAPDARRRPRARGWRPAPRARCCCPDAAPHIRLTGCSRRAASTTRSCAR